MSPATLASISPPLIMTQTIYLWQLVHYQIIQCKSAEALTMALTAFLSVSNSVFRTTIISGNTRDLYNMDIFYGHLWIIPINTGITVANTGIGNTEKLC